MSRRPRYSHGPTYTRGAQQRRKRQQFLRLALIVILIAGIVIFIVRLQAHNRDVGAQNDKFGTLHYPDLEKTAGAPAGSIEKIYEGFALSFNPDTKTPDWVGWELLGTETDGPISRGNNFHQDTEMPGCPDPKDYTRSGYDRGHLCPAGEQKWSSQAMSDCFYMTNMAPQKHELNAGAWKTLEEKERIWAQRDSALVIVAGPVYTGMREERIGYSGVKVPDAFYKCILAPYANPPRSIAFVYDNARCPGNMANYATSVDEVEKLTGLDFFSALPDDLENEVEQQSDFRKWQ